MFRIINPNRLLIRGIITLVMGGVIVFMPGMTLKIVMQILGFIFMLDGLVAWLINYSGKNKQAFLLVPKGLTNFFFGSLLVLFPTLLVNVFVFVVGLLLIMAGASQFMNQISGRSVFGFSWILTLVSLIAFIAGATLITKPFESAELMLTVIGVVIMIYGSGEIYFSFKVRKAQKMNHPKQDSEIEDVDYEEVDD